MSGFNPFVWVQEEKIRAAQEKTRGMIDEYLAELKKELAEYEAEMYSDVAKEHLRANGQEANDELAGKMANELAEALRNRTFEWKRPFPKEISPCDREKMDEMLRDFDLHMHDVLEQLGYGPYNSEQKSKQQQERPAKR